MILFFGLIRKYKGLDVLLQSIPLVKEKLNDFVVLVVGECYDDIDKLPVIVEEVKSMLQAHPEIAQDQTMIVNFDSFSPSSLDFQSPTSGLTSYRAIDCATD